MKPVEQREEERLRALGLALAHAVRSPLASMRALAEEGRERAAARPWSEGFALIDGQIERIDAMLGDFAVLVRARAARRRPVALRPLLEDASAALVRRETMAPLPIAIDAPDDEVAVDPGQVARLLSELLANALEAPGVARVTLSATRAPGELRIVVRDDGAGIPPASQSRVGEPFFSTKAWGTGLGLAVCRQHARAHGGELTIESAARGTAVIAVLRLGDEGG